MRGDDRRPHLDKPTGVKLASWTCCESPVVDYKGAQTLQGIDDSVQAIADEKGSEGDSDPR